MTNTIKYIVFLTLLTFCCGCGLIDYGNGVKNDTEKVFLAKKKFFNRLSFNGHVKEKKMCSGCILNKYSLTIIIDSLVQKPTFSDMHYEPYYFFSADSILVISVSKQVFDSSTENAYIKKYGSSNSVFIYDKSYLLLSEDKESWIP